MYIYSYKYSEGAKALAKVLGAKMIKHRGSRFKGNSEKTLINWGAFSLSKELLKCNVLNYPDSIREASGKLSFFRTLKETDLTPKFTESMQTAIEWQEKGMDVVCRTMLNASGGKGIVIGKIVKAPLYVQYIPKKSEYRVHFLDDEVIDIQRKAKLNNVDEPNWQVRNLEGGFIYARNNIEVPNAVLICANAVIRSFNLDFGAIDIIYNEKHDRAYALEINTAPGLEGQTVEIYSNAFKEFLGEE